LITSLPHSHSLVDRVFDYLLNDGPNNLYALICSQCFTHNGLVVREAINVRYRCVNCHHMNGPPIVDKQGEGENKMENMQKIQKIQKIPSSPQQRSEITQTERSAPSSAPTGEVVSDSNAVVPVH